MPDDAIKESKPRPRILIVDDHVSMAEMLAEGLSERGYDVVAMGSSREAAKRLQEDQFAALVTDLRMPDVDGLGLLALSRKTAPNRPVLVMTAYSAVDTAIESIRQGAYHYLTKPFKVDELALFLGRALEDASVRREAATLKRALKEQFATANILGRGRAMQEVRDLIERVADADAPVLITGETGTGKGIVARAIHAQGGRGAAPFISVNCAALPENLLESELFGHAKGAFTGATSSRAGLFEEASGGTLFLDEIGEMAPGLQAKLLHVLETGTVRAVGSNKERRMDTRILAATHRDLRARVLANTFREDLLYRLDVVTIDLPPLRHRREDLPMLMDHFLGRTKAKHPKSPVQRLSPEVVACLLEHEWPGNVRELEHVLERVVLLGRAADVAVADLPPTVVPKSTLCPTFRGEVVPMKDMQHLYAVWAFEQLGGRKLLTAEKLDVDVKTFAKWLQGDSKE